MSTTRFLPSASILEHFRKLPSNDGEERLKAASAIIAETSDCETDFDKTVQYVLTRLTKGLASGTESSRLGFSIAYTEFLRQALGAGSLKRAGITLRGALQLLKEHTTPPSDTSGREERDNYFGRLFGLKAIIQSGAVFSSPESTKAFWTSIVDELFQLAKKKSWLRESCASTICRTILASEKDDEEVAEILLIAHRSLKESGLENTSEGVAIKLALFEKCAHLDDDKNILEDDKFPLEKRNLPTLAKLLKESSKPQDGLASITAQKGNWSAKLPFVWDVILRMYLGGGLDDIAPNAQEKATFQEFWKVVVDESLFAANSSDERKFWGFQVFSNALEFTEDTNVAETVFSQNFMKCFINQLSNSDRYLHKVAMKAARTIHAVGEKHSNLVPTFVEQLLLHHGSPNFDKLTKTKTVEKLIPLADENGLQRLVAIFRNVIEQPKEDDEKQCERIRQWAADQLLTLVRNKKIEKRDSWLEPIVDLLAIFGHFNSNGKDDMTDASHGTFRSRLLSCLAALIESKETSGSKWACRAVKRIVELEKAANYTFVIEMDSEIQDEKNKAAKTLHNIKKRKKEASKKDRKQLEAFELLYALVFLQICNGDADAVNVAEELQLCYEKISQTKKNGDDSKHKHRSKRVKMDRDDEEEDVDTSQVLTEVLLSFVSRPSLLLRRLANTVFTVFVDGVTESSLNLMFDVLATKETMEGQSALFNEDGSDEGEGNSDDDDDSDEIDSDVEVIVNGNHQAPEVDEDNDDSDEDRSEEGEGDEDIEGMDEEAAMKLDADLAALLGVSKPDASAMDVDGNDDDDDESMDDDEMLKMDEKIAEVFRQRSKASTASKKKMRKDAKENVINFKNRVLELLEIYVKHQFADELSLNVMLPCLELMRTTSSKAIAEKAHGVVKALVQASKGKGGGKDAEKEQHHHAKAAELLPVPSDPKALLKTLITAIHDEAGQGRTHQHASACSQCSLHVVRVLVNANDKYLEKVFKLYAESMARWMRDEKYNPQHNMFSDLVTWAGTVRNQFCSK